MVCTGWVDGVVSAEVRGEAGMAYVARGSGWWSGAGEVGGGRGGGV